MRRLYAVLMMLLVLFGIVETSASSILTQCGFITEDVLSDEIITRGDCIKAIVKACGATEKMNQYYKNLKFYKPIFDDSDLNDSERGYILAAKGGGIAYGEFFSSTGARYFYPERFVTLGETLAFMLRCLSDDEITPENSCQKALEIGLIFETDDFGVDPTLSISPKAFCTLLERFLLQSRYKYVPDETSEPKPAGIYNGEPYYEYFPGEEWEFDEKRSKSYIDMFQ